jgi:hypothetical protein
VAATLSAAALSAAHEASDLAHELAGERSARHLRMSKDGVPRTVSSACASIDWRAGMQQPATSVQHAAAIEEPRRRNEASDRATQAQAASHRPARQRPAGRLEARAK